MGNREGDLAGIIGNLDGIVDGVTVVRTDGVTIGDKLGIVGIIVRFMLGGTLGY